MTQAFNLSQFANYLDSGTGKLSLTSGNGVSGTLQVSNGGTGVSSIPTSRVMLGSGTSGVSTVATTTSGGSAVSAGMLLTYQGSSSNPTWELAPVSGVGIAVFGSSGTWTVPPGVTKAIVWIYGGGFTSANQYYNGGYGGLAVVYITSGLGSAQYVTVGGVSGSSAFGGFASATGASGRLPANWGTGVVSSGTTIFTGSCGRSPYAAGTNTMDILNVLSAANYIGNPAGQSFGMAGWFGFSGQVSAIGGGVIIQY